VERLIFRPVVRAVQNRPKVPDLVTAVLVTVSVLDYHFVWGEYDEIQVD